MKIYCKISGLQFYSSQHFKEERVVEHYHPIFFTPTKQLLTIAGKCIRYGDKLYTHEEQKLLFLAMLHATEAVEWETPAYPSIQTVKKYVEGVFKTLTWYDMVSAAHLQLPRMRVTEQNYKLENTGLFIEAWYTARKEIMAPASRKLLQDLVEQREFNLNRLIHSNRSNDQIAKRLASWAIDVGRVEGEEKRQEWFDIISCKETEDALRLDLEELNDIIDHMGEELIDNVNAKAGSIYAFKLMEHLNKLKKIREGGMLGLISDSVGGIQNTFRIKMETATPEEIILQAEDIEAQLRDSGAPEQEPKKEHFIGKMSDYIRARAKWILTADLRENLQLLKDKDL